MHYVTLQPETIALLKQLSRGNYFFDRLTRANQLILPESIYRELERKTPYGKSMDWTIRQLIHGTEKRA